MKHGFLYTSLFTALGVILSFNASAQMLGGEEAVSGSYSSGSFSAEKTLEKQNLKDTSAPAQKPNTWGKDKADAQKNTNLPTTNVRAAGIQKNIPVKAASPKKDVPIEYQQMRITKDGVEFINEEAILLYYTNFKINHTSGTTVSCDVRFIVKTALADTLSNISMRLKWPKMETTLTFDDVAPGKETYYDYRLYGEGCYSMDKLPNVIVNRCRLKDHTQKECAALIKLGYYN